MGNISNYVDVAISLETTAISQAGFGTVLIVSTGLPASFGSDRVRFYEDMDGVEGDFTSATPEYAAAQAAFSQDPKPAKVAIGAAEAVVAGVGTITFVADFVASNEISVTINGTPVTVTFTTDHATTIAALATAIEALDDVADATANAVARTINITSEAGYPLAVSNITVTGGASQTTGSYAVTTPAVTLADALGVMVEENNDWYGIVITDKRFGNFMTVSGWAEARVKIFGFATNDANILTSATTDVMSKLKAKAVTRTFGMYSANPGQYAEAALMGKELAEAPGSTTWMFKTLAGVTADNLTSTERLNAIGKNCNVYTTVNGVNITEQGKMLGGQFIDIIHGRDWLEARIAEDVFARLVNAKKIPYTNKGAAVLENAVRSRLKNAQSVGVLTDDEDPVITIPKVSEQMQADRANRHFPDLKFSAKLAGAIHSVAIRGTITV